MRVRITHLKAPWPQGACVGDVVEVDGGVVPAWAAGKCSPVADAAPVDHAMPHAEDAQIAAALADAEAQAAGERQALQAKATKGAKAAKG